jgi:peptide-methionine (R)-S-oxide reductase
MHNLMVFTVLRCIFLLIWPGFGRLSALFFCRIHRLLFPVIFFLLAVQLSSYEIPKTVHSERQWRTLLGSERFCVMRRKATEKAYSGLYLHEMAVGTYVCAGCQLPLFHSSSKYDAGIGWPCFHKPIVQKHVWIKEDWSLPFRRYEVLCRSCDSHLGHVFRQQNGSLRYTINSIALEWRSFEQ